MGCKEYSCPPVSGKTDSSGFVHIEEVRIDTRYMVWFERPDLIVLGDNVVEGWEQVPRVRELRAGLYPKEPGVYILHDNQMSRIRTRTRLMTDERVKGSDVPAVYPESIFQTPSMVRAGQHLVLVGASTIQDTRFEPIISEPAARTFDSGASLAGHAFVGLRFASDEDYEVVVAELDTEKVIDVGEGAPLARRARYIPVDALPAGHYALSREGSQDALVVGFEHSEVSAPKPVSGLAE
jgi:hypothetical protein